MAKYHINPKTGRAGQCHAEDGKCPHGVNTPHHSTENEAREAYEKSQEHNLLNTVSVCENDAGASASFSKNYSKTETAVLSVFPPGERFTYQGKETTVVRSGKPVVQRGGGEGKTDVYVGAVDSSGNPYELKISIKQSNAEFLENKVGAPRLQAIFGDEWESRLAPSFRKFADIVEKHVDNPITDKGMCLGYRVDFMTSDKRKLATEIELSPQEKQDILSGNTLPEVKRDSVVNGEVVAGSGVADYMFFGDADEFPSKFSSAQDVVDSLAPISDYARSDECKIYMTGSAVNLRPGGKHEKGRPLALVWDYSGSQPRIKKSDFFAGTSSTRAKELLDSGAVPVEFQQGH